MAWMRQPTHSLHKFILVNLRSMLLSSLKSILIKKNSFFRQLCKLAILPTLILSLFCIFTFSQHHKRTDKELEYKQSWKSSQLLDLYCQFCDSFFDFFHSLQKEFDLSPQLTVLLHQPLILHDEINTLINFIDDYIVGSINVLDNSRTQAQSTQSSGHPLKQKGPMSFRPTRNAHNHSDSPDMLPHLSDGAVETGDMIVWAYVQVAPVVDQFGVDLARDVAASASREVKFLHDKCIQFALLIANHVRKQIRQSKNFSRNNSHSTFPKNAQFILTNINNQYPSQGIVIEVPISHQLQRIGQLTVILIDLGIEVHTRSLLRIIVDDSPVRLRSHLLPVSPTKDLMLTHTAHPFLRILLQSSQEEEDEILGQIFTYFWCIVLDAVDEGVVVAGMEGTLPVQHLIEDASHAVDVALVVYLSPALEPLRSEVQWRPQKGLSVVLFIIQLLRQSEVYQGDMPPVIDHYILWFKVPVDDLVLMQVLYGKDKLSEDDECLFGFERAKISDMLACIGKGLLRSPVGMYSRAMYKFSGVWKAKQSGMMYLHPLHLISVFSSVIAYFIWFRNNNFSLLSCFKPKRRFFLYARQTIEKAPLPIRYFTQNSDTFTNSESRKEYFCSNTQSSFHRAGQSELSVIVYQIIRE